MFNATTEESIVPEIVTWLRGELSPRYAIERILGAGGMETVLRATELEAGRRVATQVMHRDLVLEMDAARRFAREAQAAASMKSEHVARIYAVDTTPSGVPFIGMEHLEGLDLGHLSRRRPIATGDALRWVMEASIAVEETHAVGLVHRDLKPENLFLTSAGIVKVLDFGLAKNLTPSSADPPS